jgi:hypothetical protein
MFFLVIVGDLGKQFLGNGDSKSSVYVGSPEKFIDEKSDTILHII